MKHLFLLITLLSLFSCQDNSETTTDWDDLQVCRDLYGRFSECEEFFNERKQMLRQPVAKMESSYASIDPSDPNARWLLWVMMDLEAAVDDYYDCWACMLNIDDYIKEYNRRLGRQIGSSDLAMAAIEELVAEYQSGQQYDMNRASSELRTVDYYKTVKAYSRYISIVDQYDEDPEGVVPLSDLCYYEFGAWFDIVNASRHIMYEYTYVYAQHSALPMDLNGNIRYWMNHRKEILDHEQKLLAHFNPERYHAKERTIKTEKFDALINQYYDLCMTEKYPFPPFKDTTKLKPISFQRLRDQVYIYEEALIAWRVAREKIEDRLPLESRSSYRAITNDLHTFFYDTLNGLLEPEC